MSVDYNHGVHYLPSTVPRGTRLTIDQLEDVGIRYIRVQWVDYTNVVRSRVLPASYFRELLKSTRPGIGVAKVTLGAVYLTIADGFSPCGEYLYVPDLSTLRVCPYAPGEAVVMGWFEEKTPYLGTDNKLTLDVPLCPRATLRRITQQASAAGVDFLVGFESEFVLLKSTKPVEVSSHHTWSANKGFLPGSIESVVLKEIADGIQESGIELQIYHPEAAHGQYEMVTGPLTPLDAVDALVHTREIIVSTAAKHGMHATFAPRISMESPGSSTHTHISVHSKNNVKTPEKISSLEASFLSSILTHLPALTAFTLPIPASYKRVVDGVWSGGTYVHWGTENREAPVRLSNATSPSSRNFEIRFVDGAANPYLALAGILGVGFAGIQGNVELTVQDCPGSPTAAEMSEEERQALGITQRMSLTWEESRKRLSENALLRDRVLGSELVEKYLSVNKTLADALGQDGNDEAAALTRLVEFY